MALYASMDPGVHNASLKEQDFNMNWISNLFNFFMVIMTERFILTVHMATCMYYRALDEIQIIMFPITQFSPNSKQFIDWLIDFEIEHIKFHIPR